MKLERPMAVQILLAQNVGVPKRASAEGEDGGEGGEEATGQQEEEKKFESTYLDRNLVKEKNRTWNISILARN